jgi:hypothetical protein
VLKEDPVERRDLRIFKPMEFPIYAKHADGSVWYEFISASHFHEWKQFGMSKGNPHFLHTETISEDYSTTLYIRDLLDLVSQGVLETVGPEEVRSAVGGSQ